MFAIYSFQSVFPPVAELYRLLDMHVRDECARILEWWYGLTRLLVLSSDGSFKSRFGANTNWDKACTSA